MQIRELSFKELLSAYELVHLLHPTLDYDLFEDLIYEMRHIEYKMLGVFEKEQLISYAGVAVSTDLIYKRHLRVLEFITDPRYDTLKYDALLYEYLIDYAKMGMCEYLVFSQEENGSTLGAKVRVVKV